MFQLSKLATTVFVGIITFATSSNIDTSYPIILKNSADGSDSLFGTTVLLISKDRSHPGIIIGAPKANSTLPNHKNIHEPGVLWQCSLDVSTGSGNACRVLVMDPTGNEVTIPGKVKDRKDEGWLGGSLTKNSENFVSCANRWSNNFDRSQYNMNGICMLRSGDEIFEDRLPNPSNESRFLPLIDSGLQGKNIYGMGQAGFSVHLSPNNELVLGAPGVQNGKGTVIRYSNDAFGNQFREEMILLPEKVPELHNSSYFGFSLSSGNFFDLKDSNNKQQYVSGAPRGNDLTGKVIVFRFPEVNEKMEKLFEIDGSQTGAYFGSSICVIDINSDGFDDLLIGAPRHSTEHKRAKLGLSNKRDLPTTKDVGYGDEGSVFVYISTGKSLVPQMSAGLAGNGRPWAQFGTAIVSLGDIDNDGYPDIAIGAPYDNYGKGLVYIYKGGMKGLQRQSAQIIEASKIDSSLRGFGYSISPSEDIDDNGYNDLAVGAYDSGHVVLLRTRPLVNISGEIQSTLSKLPFDTKSFEIDSCVSYSGEYAPDKLDLSVTIYADIESLPQRVLLQLNEQGDSSASKHTYLEETTKGLQACTKFIAIVTRPLESSGRPIKMRQQITIAESRRTTGPTIYEIKESGGDVRTDITGLGYKSFCKNCPMKDESRSKIEDLVLPLAVVCGDDDKCVSDLRLDISMKNLQEDATFMIGSFPDLPMDIKVTNHEETAISPSVTVSWQNIQLKKIPSECRIQSLRSNKTFTSYKCSLGRTLEKGLSAKVQLEFDTSDLVVGTLKDLWFHIEAETASDTLNPTANTVILPLTVNADITINGDESLNSFNPTTVFAATNFYQSFAVFLHGVSPIAGVNLEFLIPKSFTTKSGSTVKINVYEPDVTRGNGNIRCLPTKGSFDSKAPVDLSSRIIKASDSADYDAPEEETIHTGGIFPRVKGDDKSIFSTDKTASSLLIECSSELVECIKVQCTSDTFYPGKEERINFPMSVSTSDLKSILAPRKLNLLKILSEGRVNTVGADIDILPESKYPDDTIALTVIQLDMQKVSRWIYVVSIIVGLFLLTCVAYCLYWCGCFKRKPKPGHESENKDGNEYETVPLRTSRHHGDDESGNESERKSST